MGRIKTKLIKRVSLKLFNEHQDELKKEYVENKSIVRGLADIKSKKMLNVISGYVTRLMKNRQEI